MSRKNYASGVVEFKQMPRKRNNTTRLRNLKADYKHLIKCYNIMRKVYDGLLEDYRYEVKHTKRDPCPKCGGKYDSIEMEGKQLDPSLSHGAAERTYEVCPACKYIYSSSML